MILGGQSLSTPSLLPSLGGGRRTTQLTRAYDDIVCAFADAGKRVNISRRELEAALAIHVGASKPDTVARNISMMQTLGYIKLVEGASIATGQRYDLVGKKVEAARRQLSLEESLPKDRRGKPRL